MYWKQEKALNHVRMWKSVFTFLWFFSILAMAFCSNSHVHGIRFSSCIYSRSELGYNLARKSMKLMIQYLIKNKIFLNLFDWRKFLNWEILVPLIGTRNSQHILSLFASPKDWKLKSLYFLHFKLIKWIKID